MHKNIDFTKLGGFGVTQDTFAFLQEGVRAVTSALGTGASGTNGLVILSGFEDLGTTWGEGYVSIHGEVLPFEGGVKLSQIIIEETSSTAPFADLTNKEVYYTRKAKMANVGGFDFVDFVRQKTISELNTLLESLVIAMPKTGFITMYSGDVLAIPDGWALCDGSNGTPDLRGRFVVGYSGAGDYSTVGNIGGAEEVVLTEGQLPSVEQSITLPNRLDRNWFNNGGNTHKIFDEGAGFQSITTANFGNDEPHENRPPYYVLAYIMKL